MSNFVPSKRHLREILLFCFHLGKSAAESRRFITKVYGANALSISTCEFWFRRFKSGDFLISDKERSGQPKKFDDKTLKEALNKNPSLTLQQLADVLDVNTSTVGKRLKSLGIKQKKGNWVQTDVNS